MKTKRKCVYIEWLDSTGWEGWVHWSKLEGETKEKDTIKTVGFVDEESDKSVLVSPHISDITGCRSGSLRIPKCAIVKRKNIRITR